MFKYGKEGPVYGVVLLIVVYAEAYGTCLCMRPALECHPLGWLWSPIVDSPFSPCLPLPHPRSPNPSLFQTGCQLIPTKILASVGGPMT